jgi:RimJ/RimL family protein N-acetyltransferase
VAESKVPSSDATVLTDGVVRLRTLHAGDYEALYAALAVPRLSLFSRTRGLTPAPDEFRRALWAGVFIQFAVEDVARRGTLLGVVGSYNANHRSGTVYLSMSSTDASSLGNGKLLRGMIMLIDYLFDNWAFRKLYFESAEPSFRTFQSALGSAFVEEGRLRDFEYLAGMYCDVVICAIVRDTWTSLRHKGEPLSESLVRFSMSRPSMTVAPLESETQPHLSLWTFEEFQEVVVSVLSEVPNTSGDADLPFDSLASIHRRNRPLNASASA